MTNLKYFIAITSLLTSQVILATEQTNTLWSAELDFSYTKLTGNTQETNTAGKIALTRQNLPWKWNIVAESYFTQDKNTRTAEKYAGLTRLAYNFNQTNFLFGRATYETDKFSGFDYQSTLVVGLGWNIFALENVKWDAEAGAGLRFWRVDIPVLGSHEDELIGTISSQLDWNMTKSTHFKQYFRYEVGSETNIAYSNSEIKVQIIGNLAFKLSYNLKHTSNVPFGTQKLDTETIVSLNYTL